MNYAGLVNDIITKSITVTTTASRLDTSFNGCHTIEVQNNGSTAVFLGDSSVTASSGIKIAGGTSKIIPVNHSAVRNLYIVAGGAGAVVVLAKYLP